MLFFFFYRHLLSQWHPIETSVIVVGLSVMSLYDSIVIEAHLPLAIRNICLCRRKYFTLKLLTLNRSGEAVPVFGLSLEIVVDMQSNLGKWLAEKPKSPKISNDEAFRDLFSNLVGYRKRNVFWECKFYSRSSWGNGHPQHWRQMIEGSALAWSVWHLRKQKKKDIFHWKLCLISICDCGDQNRVF